MGTVAWMRRTMRQFPHPDIAVAAVAFAFTLLVTAAGPHLWRGQLSAASILAAGVACGSLVWRHRWPFLVVATATAGAAAYLVTSRAQGLALAAPMIALYTAADTTGRRKGLIVGWLAVVMMVGTHTMFGPGNPWFSWENLALIALGGLAVAAGDASRSRRAYIAAFEERARRAETDREQEAQRRVIEERLRIARDLHDVVGHQLALINVQAGVAAHVLEDQPDQARQALAHVRQASRAALGELQDTIWLLRQPGDPTAPTEPTVGLRGLGDMLASFARSGLRIDQDVNGTARQLPSIADLTAYRVIQESLTNVRKHAGDASARVRLSYDPAALHIVVEDDGVGSREHNGGDGTGHGIAGMRERVAAVGGHLNAGPLPDGGFRVSAVVPLRVGERDGGGQS
jgi:signal transduction histidine kinase